eukprot:g25882.t1
MQSLLKYPNIICGGDGHGVMLVFGILLLSVGVFGFLALCIYAATMMPKWSASDRRHLVQGFRFLVFRFRLDSWWYGVPLLVRGPLLSLPIVLATDYPPMQTIFVNVILAVFLIIETLSWPWKVPLLHLVFHTRVPQNARKPQSARNWFRSAGIEDLPGTSPGWGPAVQLWRDQDMWMTLCLMLLVMGSALYLEPVEGAMKDFAAGFSTAVMVCIGMAMLMMAIVATAALVHRAAMGGAQEYSIFNMGKVAPAPLVYQRLIALSAELQKLDESWVQGRIASMSAFDIRLITGCITLLAIDCVPHKADELKFNFARVSAQSFAVRGKTQKNIYKEPVCVVLGSLWSEPPSKTHGDALTRCARLTRSPDAPVQGRPISSMCEALWSLLQRCAELHGNPSAAEVLHVWHDDRVTAGSNEDFLGAAIFTLAAAALQGQSLLEKEDSIVGVELCMGLAQDLDAAARQRLSHMVLERTLRRMDHTGDEIATKASRELLLRGLVTSPKECTQPLRSLLALLLRCEGEECIGAQEPPKRLAHPNLLELTKGDVALAVALVAEALAAPKPPGLPLWPLRLCTMLQSMDFLRLGFRFLAPFGRKLIEDSGNRDAAKVLRMLCRTFSWLMVHAGFDGSPFLAESLKPLAAEWLLRANKRGDTVKKAQLALAILAANTGAASAPPTRQLEIVLDRLAHDPLFDFTEELQRWGAFTQQGVDTFYSLGFYVNCTELNTGEIDSDDDWPGEVDLAWRIAPPSLPDEGRPCHECGKASEQGQFGEGGRARCLRRSHHPRGLIFTAQSQHLHGEHLLWALTTYTAQARRQLQRRETPVAFRWTPRNARYARPVAFRTAGWRKTCVHLF